MIEASFSGMAERSAAISGAYQYDTGQRLRMHGLPSPEELAGRDDFLSGDVVTVQAQYAYEGDSQTEMRLAIYDEETDTWMAAVPDTYLMQNADVHVYVYVGYGQTEESMRAKTCYEAVFRPVGRPAPGTEVTPDQKNAWDALMQEVNLAIAGVNTAASNANAWAEAAKEASEQAKNSAKKTEEGMVKLDATAVTAYTLPPASAATVTVTDLGTHREVVFGIPKGDPGIVMINGKEVTDSGTIDLTPEDIGAMPADHQLVNEFEAVIPVTGWYQDGIWFNDIDIDGILSSDSPVVEADLLSVSPLTQDAVERVLDNWAKITRIVCGDGSIRVACIGELPDEPILIRLLCVR